MNLLAHTNDVIRHTLLFKFNEGVDQQTRNLAVQQLQQLEDLCPTIGAWCIGVNTAVSPSAWDVIEIGDFQTPEDLSEYKTHPAHVAFSAFMGTIATWALVDCSAEAVSNDYYLHKAQSIPPHSVLLHGAKHGSQRGNVEYRQLRERLAELVGDRLSVRQLGRVATKLSSGTLPREYFEHIPGVATTYKATIQTAADYERITDSVGVETAKHLLLTLEAITDSRSATNINAST